MNKTFRILEIIWLIMGALGIGMCIYFIINQDNEGSIYFLVFTVICGVMYSVRKRQRKRHEEAVNAKQQQK
ncbi:MAG: hypothetical protein M3R27_09015 [Bacteroidota bacterium]|nr:hypothetical protein [Bacteroidota bacterium]